MKSLRSGFRILSGTKKQIYESETTRNVDWSDKITSSDTRAFPIYVRLNTRTNRLIHLTRSLVPRFTNYVRSKIKQDEDWSDEIILLGYSYLSELYTKTRRYVRKEDEDSLRSGTRTLPNSVRKQHENWSDDIASLGNTYL